MGQKFCYFPNQFIWGHSADDVSLFLWLFSSRFYFIAYEIDAPLKLRYERFTNKYLAQKTYTLSDFVDLDDKIKFNSEEYCLFATGG
jgi:hypothetical protein